MFKSSNSSTSETSKDETSSQEEVQSDIQAMKRIKALEEALILIKEQVHKKMTSICTQKTLKKAKL